MLSESFESCIATAVVRAINDELENWDLSRAHRKDESDVEAPRDDSTDSIEDEVSDPDIEVAPENKVGSEPKTEPKTISKPEFKPGSNSIDDILAGII